MKRLALLGLLGVASIMPACGDDPLVTPEDGRAECEEIGELCHPVMTTLGQECHDVGHVGEGQACLDRYDECIAECEGAQGTGGAGGNPG